MSLYRPTTELPGWRAHLSPAQWLTLYTIAMAAIPPVYAYATGGLQTLFDYLAADAFIYLSVAAKSQFGAYTYDGTYLTNGFHPLWQMLSRRPSRFSTSLPRRNRSPSASGYPSPW